MKMNTRTYNKLNLASKKYNPLFVRIDIEKKNNHGISIRKTYTILGRIINFLALPVYIFIEGVSEAWEDATRPPVLSDIIWDDNSKYAILDKYLNNKEKAGI